MSAHGTVDDHTALGRPAGVSEGVVAAAWRDADECAHDAGVTVRLLDTADETIAASDLLARVWEMENTQSHIDPGMLVALAHFGNYVAGAFRGSELVAVSVGFFHPPPARAIHSHITGVVRNQIGHGVGRALKLHQRAWCLERGLVTITWTYDPLVARNAYFNLHKLGGRAVEYFPDFYGQMRDGLNRGQSSDRILLVWELTRPWHQRAGRALPDFAALARGPIGPTIDLDIPTQVDVVRVELPEDIEAIRARDPAAAREWRAALRRVLTELLDHGWRLTDFDRLGHYRAERNLS